MATCSASFFSHSTEYPSSININLFPIELIILIFELVISSSPRANTQFHLAWVCRYWRHIIFENSRFWKTLSFISQGSSDPKYMELVLCKSGSRELALFGPRTNDIELNPAKWIAFYELFQNQSSRVKTLLLDGLPEYLDDQLGMESEPLPLFPNIVFENLQILSLVWDDVTQINFQSLVPNLQALQLTTYAIMNHSDFPPRLKKLNISAPYANNDFFKFLLGTKELEYLSIFFEDPLYQSNPNIRIKLPNLITLKSNGSADLVDILYAPALKHLEIAAPHYKETIHHKASKIVRSLDLSEFTHLYVGYTLSNSYDPRKDYDDRDVPNPIDGCIWASIGPVEISCLSHRSTIFRGQEYRLTELPSSWSDFGPDDEPLIHVHTIGSYNFSKGSSTIPCKLIAQMVSLETLVLCFPDDPYPPNYRDYDDLKPYHFDLTNLFGEIAHPDTELLHLVIRSARLNIIDILQQVFDEEIWSQDSCPLLESITFHAPSPRFFSRDSRYEFWVMWISFIAMRQDNGRPLKLLRIIGAYPPSPRALKKLEEFSEFTKVIVEDADDTAYCDVVLNPDLPTSSLLCNKKRYPKRGF